MSRPVRWLGNAAVYEANRKWAEARAAAAEADGQDEDAAKYRRSAVNWAKRRDDDQRLMEQRTLHRSARRRH